MPDLVTSHANQLEQARDHARSMMAGYVGRAVEVLTEIMEIGENDRVRLSAANSLLDRAGVVAPPEVKDAATAEEHQLVKAEAEQVLQRIEENVRARDARQKTPSLEAVMVHEGEDPGQSAN